MKTATVRDLRYRFPQIETHLREGDEITITKRRRAIARLVPLKPKPLKKPVWPDVMALLNGIYGDRVSKVTTAKLVAEDRERY